MLTTTWAPTTVAISLKMYFSASRTAAYCRSLADLANTDNGIISGATDLMILPTFVSLVGALQAVADSKVYIGAQDLAVEDSGPFTGEVSGAELAEIGCTHVEIGHAERRNLFGDTDSVVAAKARAALRHKLVPLLCVGEPAAASAAETAQLCVRQVVSATTGAPQGRIIIAYEPIWAIGAHKPAPSSYVTDVCQRIRIALTDHLPDFAILYGGSAGPGLLTDLGGSVDGLFLGRYAHNPAAVADVLAEAAKPR